MDTLNPNDPLSSLNGTTVQGTASNLINLKKYTANEAMTISQEDSIDANNLDKQSTALTNSAKNANITTSGRLIAEGHSAAIQGLSQWARNQSVLLVDSAEHQKQNELSICRSIIAYNLEDPNNTTYQKYENSCTKSANNTTK
jgi:hypothetical protein